MREFAVVCVMCLLGCSSNEPDPPPSIPSCDNDESNLCRVAALAECLTDWDVQHLPQLIGTAGDLDGDGSDELAYRDGSDLTVQFGPFPGARSVRILNVPDQYGIVISHGDLNNDDQPDLILTQRWENEVSVFYSPLDSDRNYETPDVKFSAPQDIGLASWFGVAVLVADVTGDGINDAVIGEPAEREEACAGGKQPYVFAGPFDVEEFTPDDALIRLPGDPGSCAGENFFLREDALVVGGQEPVIYELPLSSPPVVIDTISTAFFNEYNIEGNYAFANGHHYTVESNQHDFTWSGENEEGFRGVVPVLGRQLLVGEWSWFADLELRSATMVPNSPDVATWDVVNTSVFNGNIPQILHGADLDGNGVVDLVGWEVVMECAP